MISADYVDNRSIDSGRAGGGFHAILVCGVDISESTALKIKYPISGVGVISTFMESFDKGLRESNHQVESGVDTGWFLWRVRGDELVYLRTIPIGDDGRPEPVAIGEALQQFIASLESVSPSQIPGSSYTLKLRSYAFLLHSQGNPWDYRWNLMPKDWNNNLKGKEDLKNQVGSLGIGSFADLKSFSDCRINLREIQKDYFIDFIGADVDLGFRVAEQSEAHRMILSPYLAYLVMVGLEKNKISPFSIYSMGERELKGCTIKETGLVEYPLYYVPIGNFSILEELTGAPMQINISKEIKKLEEFEKSRNDSYRFIYEKALKHASAAES